MTAARADLDAFVARARAVSCEEVAADRGWTLRRSGQELVGPCPACGGTDRFAINRRKNVFSCRRGGVGGDAIALVQYVDGVDFLEACSRLLNEPVPDRNHAPPDPAEIARREIERAARRAAQEAEAARWRDKARAEAFNLWRRALPAAGTAVEAYLAGRGLPCPRGLRFAPALGYWTDTGEGGAAGRMTCIHEGPVMVAPIQRPDGTFGAVHLTWIDPARPGRKAAIAHPATGEILPAKKVRGSAKGGAIRLAGPADAARMVVGEGIETTLTLLAAERGKGLGDGTAYWSAVSLSFLGGRPAASVPHPSAEMVDAAGRRRRRRVAGPDPDMTDRDAFVPPTGVRELVLLGDGDSDRFTTEACLTRAARRAMRLVPGLAAAIKWAPEGADFNDVLRGEARLEMAS